jgi:hemoglobin-like flavoprotein
MLLTGINPPAARPAYALRGRSRMNALNTELIAQTWEAVEDHGRFVEDLYQRFFQRFPGYRPLFPHRLDAAHLAKMVETLSLMSRLAEDKPLIAPHMRKVGATHRPYALGLRDLGNFKAVFLEMLGEHLGNAWSSGAEHAWGEAFDQVIIPLMREGA